ncbi:MAG: STAS domain-containing protein [Flavobacteriales bacterium]
MGFSFDTETQNGVCIISCKGRLMDKSEAIEFISEIDDHLIDGVKYFVLNFSNLEYINSSGLGVFINLLTRIRNAGGELILTQIGDKIQQLMLITKLNSVFTITETTEDALLRLVQPTQ